ncbi:hypothetical protein GJAV_G00175240 [Gymnothorax javanicus]|nr:hypothetical protein GJAV_G00175240 [Gymnothorax javanicus]
MEDVYVSFESYDFNGDAKYQDGLKRLRLTEENYEHILKLKISYYNRFVQRNPYHCIINSSRGIRVRRAN